MGDEKTESNGVVGPSSSPPLQALEAAARIRLVKLIKGQKVQPSRKAVEIAAKMMANKALLELREKPAKPDDAPRDR